MKKLTYWLLKYQFYLAKKSAEKETNSIVKKAKNHRVEIYNSALLMLSV